MRALDRIVNMFDPLSFARSLGFEPDEFQAEFLMSNSPREMLNWTRQGGKSTVTGLKAYGLTKTDPGLGIIVSPSERQSKEMMIKIKEFYHADPDKIELDGQASKTEVKFKNGSRIVALPANIKTIRGYSAPKWVIFDEAAMCPDEVYKGVRPMLATTPGSKLFLISTPKGKRGFFYDEWKDGKQWKKMHVKASQIKRISAEFLEEERRSLGEKWFQQEYEGAFLNVNENLFDMNAIMGAFGSFETNLSTEEKVDYEFENIPILSARYPWLNNMR